MPIERSKEKDFKPLASPPNRDTEEIGDLASLRGAGAANDATTAQPQNLINLSYNYASEADADALVPIEETRVSKDAESSISEVDPPSAQYAAYVEPKKAKKAKQVEKDRQLLSQDRWFVRNGHALTYFGLYLFSVMVLFRPYEIVPGLGFLSATAFYFALATLAIFIPNQLSTEGNLTMLSTEVKAVLTMALIALVTIPIAKDPALAWETFNEPFIKAVVIFIVLVNVVRTRRRLMGMMWLSFGIGLYLGLSAINLYLKGEFTVEEYRVGVEVGGMFGNPNDMAMHFVMMTPLAIALGIAAKSSLMRVVYFGMGGLFVAANMVTFSRGGFLGLIVCMAVLAWKIGRNKRLKISIASIIIGGIAIVAAPGNYGLRMLSIFIPGLDTVGSSDQRWELLMRSLLVTARNPWGIGIGNFTIVGIRDLQSHNAFTQVSAELGILGLIAYVVFIISPFRKLGAIERKHFEANDLNWYFYLAIGLQASIIGYLVTSFFASVAYNWFIYYLIAYAVAFRRIYNLETSENEDVKSVPLWHRQPEPTT